LMADAPVIWASQRLGLKDFHKSRVQGSSDKAPTTAAVV